MRSDIGMFICWEERLGTSWSLNIVGSVQVCGIGIWSQHIYCSGIKPQHRTSSTWEQYLLQLTPRNRKEEEMPRRFGCNICVVWNEVWADGSLVWFWTSGPIGFSSFNLPADCIKKSMVWWHLGMLFASQLRCIWCVIWAPWFDSKRSVHSGKCVFICFYCFKYIARGETPWTFGVFWNILDILSSYYVDRFFMLTNKKTNKKISVKTCWHLTSAGHHAWIRLVVVSLVVFLIHSGLVCLGVLDPKKAGIKTKDHEKSSKQICVIWIDMRGISR